MLTSRILSALVGIPVIIGFLFWGEIPFFILIALIAGLAFLEFFRIFMDRYIYSYLLLGLLGVFLISLAALLQWGMAIILGMPILILIYYLFSKTRFPELAVTMVGFLYVGLLAHLILIRALNKEGPFLVLFVLVGTWVFDSTAYGFGRLFGQRKLAPKISPNKTLEGTIAALFATSLILIIFFIPLLLWVQRLILGLSIGISATLGDLVESKFKREVGAKDTGNLIPGHGGFLDRFDSLFFTGSIAYYLLRVMLY